MDIIKQINSKFRMNLQKFNKLRKQFDKFGIIIIQHNKSNMNKNQNSHNHHHFRMQHQNLLSKKLSNIQQDFELQSQIRMPNINKKKKNVLVSEKQIDTQLNRTLKLQTRKRKNHSSLQSHDQFVNKPNLSNAYIRSENLPHLKQLAEPKRNKSSLDKILSDRNTFAKAYFEQLNKIEKIRKNQPEQQEGVQFQFPQIRVGNWKVRGYLKQDHILLKGTHKDQHVLLKKYDYKKIYEKIRKDYQSWIESKFCFEV